MVQNHGRQMLDVARGRNSDKDQLSYRTENDQRHQDTIPSEMGQFLPNQIQDT
jgi:hypothetical protein